MSVRPFIRARPSFPPSAVSLVQFVLILASCDGRKDGRTERAKRKKKIRAAKKYPALVPALTAILSSNFEVQFVLIFSLTQHVV